MSIRYWHTCDEMPVTPPVHHNEEIGWFIVDESSHEASPISCCPWCGEKLKKPSEYLKDAKRT